MIKVGIVDDHTLIRKSLLLLVNMFPGLEVIIETSNGRELIEHIHIESLDVVLLDIQMPILNGFETTIILKRRFPKIKILIVSHLSDKESVHKALECGADGFVSKNSDPEQLEIAIKKVFQGTFYFDPEMTPILHQIIFWDKKSPKLHDPFENITDKEIHLIKLVGKGHCNEEIASALFVNVRTVEKYRTQIIEKTAAKNFSLVLLWAVKHHYLNIDEI